MNVLYIYQRTTMALTLSMTVLMIFTYSPTAMQKKGAATMRKNPNKKIPKCLQPWKPTPFRPNLPQLPPNKRSKSTCTPDYLRREVFEPVLSRPIELDKLATEIIFRLKGVEGEREIRSCYGDIYKAINALMDYARILEMACEEWGLQGYHRAIYELHADKLRSIAKKYQTAIGYDYDAAVAKCEAKKKKARKDDDVGADALELVYKKSQREAIIKSADKKKKG